MDLTLLVSLCFLAPISTFDGPAETVATVNLRECLKFAPAYDDDCRAFSTDVQIADRRAKELLNKKQKMEALANDENATELDNLKAKLSQLEFEAYSQGAQGRLKAAEQAMFKKWHTQVNAAVKLVAQRENITVVLYMGKDMNEIAVAANGMQQILAQPHVGYVRDEKRRDITEKIIEEMKTAAFIESVEIQSSKSEQ